MSSSSNDNNLITNETTIWRRAWVNSALESVRSILSAAADQETSEPVVEVKKAPSIYVAWSRPVQAKGKRKA